MSREEPLCRRCDEPVSLVWHVQSGGLCGWCLADDALPLTPIRGGKESDQ